MSEAPVEDDNANISSHVLYLNSFEKWLNSMIMRNTDKSGKVETEVISKIRESFQRSVLANAHYHKGMSEVYQGTGDTSLANYHKFMSDAYSSLLCDNEKG